MTLKKFVLPLIMVFTFIILIGCTTRVSDVQSVEFVNPPKQVYKVGDDLEDIRIIVTFNNGSQKEYSIKDPAVKVKGFNTETDTGGGFRTLVVTYERASISAMYKVIPANNDPLLQYFEGKITNPEDGQDYYTIKNAQQLSNIRYALDKNFVLIDNIDLSEIRWRPIGSIRYKNYVPNKSVEIDILESFSGILDGNGYSIFNLTARDVDAPEWFIDPTDALYGVKVFSLFVATSGEVTVNDAGDNVYSTIIRDLNIVLNVDTLHNVASSAIANVAIGTKFENITTQGTIKTGGSGAGLVGWYTEDSYFMNCINKIDITSVRSKALNPTADYVMIGGIVGQSLGTSYFVNCANEGQLKHDYYNPLSPLSSERIYSIIGNMVAQVSGTGTVYYKDFDLSNSPTILGYVNGWDWQDASKTIKIDKTVVRFVGIEKNESRSTTALAEFNANITSLLVGYVMGGGKVFELDN